MDQFLLLRFAHLVGLMLMSAGLIGVFATHMRSRQGARCGAVCPSGYLHCRVL
jgi:hypothetical protein